MATVLPESLAIPSAKAIGMEQERESRKWGLNLSPPFLPCSDRVHLQMGKREGNLGNHFVIFPSRQDYWSELPFPTPRDLPSPGIKPTSPALAGGFCTTELTGKPPVGFLKF